MSRPTASTGSVTSRLALFQTKFNHSKLNANGMNRGIPLRWAVVQTWVAYSAHVRLFEVDPSHDHQPVQIIVGIRRNKGNEIN